MQHHKIHLLAQTSYDITYYDDMAIAGNFGNTDLTHLFILLR